jgi:hypothetical protein
MRWRWRGAWLWPAFAAATIADAVIGHELPPSGDTESVAAAALAGLVLNLLAVILLSRPLGMLLRRRRRDMPLLIARNYGGAFVVGLVTLAIAAVGVAHHANVMSNQRAMRDAIVRAQAFIGDRAPATFRRDRHVRHPARADLSRLRAESDRRADLLRDRRRPAAAPEQRALQRLRAQRHLLRGRGLNCTSLVAAQPSPVRASISAVSTGRATSQKSFPNGVSRSVRC